MRSSPFRVTVSNSVINKGKRKKNVTIPKKPGASPRRHPSAYHRHALAAYRAARFRPREAGCTCVEVRCAPGFVGRDRYLTAPPPPPPRRAVLALDLYVRFAPFYFPNLRISSSAALLEQKGHGCCKGFFFMGRDFH
jgi:hypothetical protein